MATQQDLQWEETLFGLVPRWKRDPSIAAVETVCRRQLNIPPQDPCIVSFHASGTFNKLYTVQSTGLAPLLLMRVTLPVYPRRKTRCEVTTLRWVRENTSVPVPEVFAFDESSDNEIGFEWILMEFVQGVSADKLWPCLSMVQKAAFTEQIAGFVAELSGLGRSEPWFRGIGTLDVLRDSDIKNNGGQADHADKKSSDNDDPGVGQKEVDQNRNAEYKVVAPSVLVAHEFFFGDHVNYDIPRGLFHSSHDWLAAMLKIVLVEQNAILERLNDKKGDITDVKAGTKDDEGGSKEDEQDNREDGKGNKENDSEDDEREDAESALHIANLLLALLPKILPPQTSSGGSEPESEPTGIYHQDLHLHNILLNEQGEIRAVIDWECVSAMPLWISLGMVPKFLDEPALEEEPQRDKYTDIDNTGEGNQLYDEHVMQYEMTQLRKVYGRKLAELWPGGLVAKKADESKWFARINLYKAVLNCDGFWGVAARKWAIRTERGEIVSMEDA